MSLISGCCGAEDRLTIPDGPEYSVIGICPACRDNCVFEEREEEDADEAGTVRERLLQLW